jgi:hypothetical protein
LSEDHFYRDLTPFHRFVDEVFEPRFYSPLPSDWLVLVADIVASTRAVESGRYAEVNYLGAACIVAVNNALDGLVVPTAFGGDGATVAVPPTAGQAAIEALLATRRWGRGAFGLELRVGRVSVAELSRRGAVIEVAKMEFSPGNALAMFRGNGFDLADALVKGDDGRHGFLIVDQPRTAKRPDLTSLSCRWAPLASQNGVMLCIIIAAHAGSVSTADAVYREALSRVNRVVALESAECSPVKLGTLRAGVRLSAIVKEAKGAPGSWLQRWPVLAVKHVLQALTFWLGLKPGGFDPDLYKHEISTRISTSTK